MKDALLRWFGPRTLDGIQKPSRMRLAARVKTPNEITSPLTGRKAALFRCGFFVRFLVADRTATRPMFGVREIFGDDEPIVKRAEKSLEMTLFLGVELLWDGILLERPEADLELPLGAIDLRFAKIMDDMCPLEEPVPAPFQAVVKSSMAKRGRVLFRETALSFGDQVTITSTVIPLQRAPASVYRGGGGALYRADPALGPVILEA